MTEPTFDKEGYPSVETLNAIKGWPVNDLRGLVTFLHEAWSTYGTWRERSNTIVLATGGWSGNEDLLDALCDNKLAWTMLWHKSERGGKFTLVMPEIAS